MTDRGSISPVLAVLAASLVMVAGMVFDGGEVIARRAEARRIASGAARAAAQHLDLGALRESGAVVVDADAGPAAARAFAVAAGGVTVDAVDVRGDEVAVTVTATHHMRILPLPPRQITVTDVARATAGVESGELP